MEQSKNMDDALYKIDTSKQSVGVMPRHIWLTKRWGELGNAILIKVENGQVVPIEWVMEYNQLDKEIRKESAI
jgi:hypothetical protein